MLRFGYGDVWFPRALQPSRMGRSACAQCSVWKESGNRPRSPLKWGVPEAPPKDDEEDRRQNVVEYLLQEGLSGREVESLDLPTSTEVIKERLEFIGSVGLDKSDILRYPLILTCSVKRNMVPVVNYLEQLGFTRQQLHTLLRKFPMVMYSSIVVDLKPVVDYLLGYGIDFQDLPNVLLRFPDVLGFKLEGTMSTSVAYLVSLGVNTRQVGPMLTRFPELLGMKVGNNIKRKVEFYFSLGLTKEQMAQLLEKFPDVLGYELEQVKLKVQHLVQAGVQRREIPSMMLRFPEMLELDMEKLTRKMAWLTEEIHVQRSDVPQVLHKLPQIVVINETKAAEKVVHLKNAGITAEDVGRMVVKCPQILAVKFEETFKPNLAFFLEQMDRPVSELVAFPVYLTYSLSQRIQPRFFKIKRRGINCSLAWFLECTNEKFQRRLSVQFMDAPPQLQSGDEEDSEPETNETDSESEFTSEGSLGQEDEEEE